tara:strand:+ start:772 stop:948 length:177 start_codon:yes stop_codon:yes gene_type:complete
MKNKKIALISLGYVGLPLAVEFGKKCEVVGFDIDKNKDNHLFRDIKYLLKASESDGRL